VKLLYDAVVGYEDDGESAMWGAGLYPDAAVRAAVVGFVSNGVEPGEQEATVYLAAAWEENPAGDFEITGWGDCGTCTVTIRSETDWTIGAFEWDNEKGVA
jgi:hypothetical protein